MAKRPLNHEEMQALRRLCLWSGMVKRTYNDEECRRFRFLAKRGLVACMDGPVKSSRDFVITEEGRIEVAKSGRFTMYEAKYLVETWQIIAKELGPVFRHAYLYANPLMGWMDPDCPWDNLIQLQRLRQERGDWRSLFYGDAEWALANAMAVVESVLSGRPSSDVDEGIDAMKARVNKIVAMATSDR